MRPDSSAVLLLDDYPDASDALALWLSLECWRPLIAESAPAAMRHLKRSAPAIMIVEPYLRAGAALG